MSPLDPTLLALVTGPDGDGLAPNAAGDALCSQDGAHCYPIRRGIPVLTASAEQNASVREDELKHEIKKYFADMWKSRQERGVRFWQDDGYSYRYCQHVVLKRAGALDGKKVLLLGAGRGYETELFQRAGAWTLTTDILLEGLINPALKHARAVMDAERLFLRNACVDVVYAQSMLMFVDERKAVAEALRVLKPGGLFISVEPQADGALFKWLHRALTCFDKYGVLGEQPPRYLTAQDLHWMRSQFAHTVYESYRMMTPAYHLPRILRLELLTRAYFGMELAAMAVLPALKRQCFMSLHVLQKAA